VVLACLLVHTPLFTSLITQEILCSLASQSDKIVIGKQVDYNPYPVPIAEGTFVRLLLFRRDDILYLVLYEGEGERKKVEWSISIPCKGIEVAEQVIDKGTCLSFTLEGETYAILFPRSNPFAAPEFKNVFGKYQQGHYSSDLPVQEVKEPLQSKSFAVRAFGTKSELKMSLMHDCELCLCCMSFWLIFPPLLTDPHHFE
jgi:hypothetical protein